MTDNTPPEDDLASQLAPLTIARQAAESAIKFAPAYSDRIAALPASFRGKVLARVSKAGINPGEESGALDAIIADYTAQYLRKRESSRLGAARRRVAKKAAALEAAALEAARKAAEPAEPTEPAELVEPAEPAASE